MHPARIRVRADRETKSGDYVLYWMQRAQRTRFNHALEYAFRHAEATGLPLVVCLAVPDDEEPSERHRVFLLEGLRDVAQNLARRRIAFVVRRGPPDAVAIALSDRAAMLVCDGGYLRHERAWRRAVAEAAPCLVIEVETDLVVPVEHASPKLEIAARTFRPKLQRALDEFLDWEFEDRPATRSIELEGDLDPRDLDGTLGALGIDRSLLRRASFEGGENAARRALDRFLAERLGRYEKRRSDPGAGATSALSPYLRYGQISPLEILLEVRAAGGAPTFLDELLVRRELAFNFVWHEPRYDRYEALPAWARRTLGEHAGDPRPAVYSEAQLDAGATHDPVWNAAMREMRRTGWLHNTLRMYWGKKILEWSESPEAAFERVVRLNDRHFLDGRDPNSYANAGWIFGLQDRPWPERPVFGKVRSMTAAGLARKFDVDAYVRGVEQWTE
ncbi:MAG: deoxyribodipyrimidine photo-lyase [Rhodospirillales bacterium]|nr:deoxyribodipyrimidine photo-lyase [Rhodospirillales bacterium]